ncbi:MAG TPA: F420-0:Gamma-glutamyl ligase, partial [Firmicutes bacterium]|nr:F420-0:Gamma-glutamyl ligase [Candidatus Fermentithermobacillaceae bacterium]
MPYRWNEENTAILRIRTHLITDKDNPEDVIHQYTRDIAAPGDLVGIAESVVAIMQGRAIEPNTVKPGILARLLSRFAHPDASISAVRSMQMAINEV